MNKLLNISLIVGITLYVLCLCLIPCIVSDNKAFLYPIALVLAIYGLKTTKSPLKDSPPNKANVEIYDWFMANRKNIEFYSNTDIDVIKERIRKEKGQTAWTDGPLGFFVVLAFLLVPLFAAWIFFAQQKYSVTDWGLGL